MNSRDRGQVSMNSRDKEEIPMSSKDKEPTSLNRRKFLKAAGIGGVGLGALSTGLAVPFDALAARQSMGDDPPDANSIGETPAGINNIGKFPEFNGPWVFVPPHPYSGFDFTLNYMSEGVAGIDPLSPNYPNGQFSNSSSLFEQFTLRNPAHSGVVPPRAADTNQPLDPVLVSRSGGDELPERSAEFWLRTINGFSDRAIMDDIWGFINWMRRVWGLDFDDPAADGFPAFGVPYQYPGSPDTNNQWSLLAPRIAVAFDSHGHVKGFARFTQTYLSPDSSYTVVARAGRGHPSFQGGIVVNGTPAHTLGNSPETPGKVRDGGVWGFVETNMDVLADIQAVRRRQRMFTTPTDPAMPLSGTTPPSPAKRGQHGGTTKTTPGGNGAQWGGWWRRVAPIVGLDVDAISPSTEPSINAVTDIATAAHPGGNFRPAARPFWPIGFYPRGTNMFWGSYNLLFGTKEPKMKIHYQSEVPTAFLSQDGIPRAFLCDLNPNPSSAEIKAMKNMDVGTGIGLFDSTGEVSGFPDSSNPELNDQAPPQAPGKYGRVHGIAYPRGVRADGISTFSHRNVLLWPPRQNVILLGDPTQPNFSNINWTIPTKGFLGHPANPTGLNPPPPGNQTF